MFNVVNSLAIIPATGRVLKSSPFVKKAPFIGNTNVGKLLIQQSSSTIKKLSLELGGDAPFIVFDDDADVDAAVASYVDAKFRSSGQICVCANRIYVQGRVYDTFAKGLMEAMSKFKLGFGFNSDTTHGPLVSVAGVDKAESHVRDAASKGAVVRIGSARAPELGPNFFQPTVLNGLNHDRRLRAVRPSALLPRCLSSIQKMSSGWPMTQKLTLPATVTLRTLTRHGVC